MSDRRAQRFFDWPHQLQKRDAILYSALMHSYAAAGDVDQNLRCVFSFVRDRKITLVFQIFISNFKFQISNFSEARPWRGAEALTCRSRQLRQGNRSASSLVCVCFCGARVFARRRR